MACPGQFLFVINTHVPVKSPFLRQLVPCFIYTEDCWTSSLQGHVSHDVFLLTDLVNPLMKFVLHSHSSLLRIISQAADNKAKLSSCQSEKHRSRKYIQTQHV